MNKLRSAVTVLAASAAIAVATAWPASASAPVNWTARTCAAFGTWEAHPGTARLEAIMADSFRVPWKYVGEDASGLYADVRNGASAKYVTEDEKYFREDCT